MSDIVKQEMTEIVTDTGTIKLSPKIIKQYLVRGNGDVTNQEVMMFLSLCKFQKLNPFINEAYLVKFGSATASIIVGKEVFTKRAFNHPKFKGLTAGIIVQRGEEIIDLEGSFKLPKDVLLGGWAIVHVEGRVPFKNTVSLEEYNKNQSTWKQIPCTMIRKVALVQALREAFPEYFQAMYSEEEMPVDSEFINNLDKVDMPTDCHTEDLNEYVDADVLATLGEVETQPQAEEMTLQEASNIKLTFGKHAGKMLGEVFESDKSWIDWFMKSKSGDPMIYHAIQVLSGTFEPSSDNESIL